MRVQHVKPLSWIIALWTPLTVAIFVHAHLHMMPNLPIRFYQNPLSSLRGVHC